jgi:hypothetical protein
MINQASRFKPRHIVSILVGVWFFLSFLGLSKTANSFFINFIPPWNRSSKGELNFWLGTILFLFPSSLLMGFGLSPFLYKISENFWKTINSISKRKFLLTIGLIFITTIILAYIAHKLILLGYPITDDEHAIQFGGRAIADGNLKVPLKVPQSTIPHLFLFIKDGYITSMDWIGGQLAWAIAEITHLGSLFFTIVGAIPILLTGLFFSRKLGKSWGIAAALIVLFSPMFFTLSMTSHSMLISRTLIALSIFLYFKAEDIESLLMWFITGSAIGLAFITRPFETAFIMAPFFFYSVYKLIKDPKLKWKMVVGLSLGMILPLILLLWHSYKITGDAFNPARLIPTRPKPKFTLSRLWLRFGSNTTYNLMMLKIWFLGPLGVLLVIAGALKNKFTILLSFSIVSVLILGLFHDNHGLHIVGPIHYSETLFPLAIIAIYGLHNIIQTLKTHKFNTTTVGITIAISILLSQGIYIYYYSDALNQQARIHSKVYKSIEQQSDPNSVILAPQFANVWLKTPKLGRRATWVFEWRRPKPDFSDNRLILHYRRRHVKTLQKLFPKRKFYRLKAKRGKPYLTLTPIKPLKSNLNL